MVFSSTAFLYLFLPLFLCSYALIPQRNLVILFFSLLFFTWGESYYVLLLLGTVSFNYWIGNRIEPGSQDRFILGTGVAVNLVVLAYYKYFGFLATQVLGLDYTSERLPHLPLGISFFTFQSISYLVDVHRGKAQRARSFSDLALYITMFPQLIAGPIVRYNTVAAAIINRTITLADVYEGSLLFIVGLSYKVLIANNVALVADRAFGFSVADLSTVIAWTGALAYTLQIYFDFAGYSLMAIGIGRILGFHFPQNFNYPYISQSITEFWRRWHMSLSSWFRDYLYIPLGGNRHGALRTYCNLAIVFLLCGLWHGAAWTFVIWGLFHGALLVLERAGLSALLEKWPGTLRRIYTLLMIVIGWIIFRAENLDQVQGFLRVMFTPVYAGTADFYELVNNETMIFALLGVAISIPVFEPFKRHILAGPARRPAASLIALSGATALAMLCTIYVMAGTYNPFIYFRF
jgi:alginate O-acetyltransferase complex protein AlgI